MSSTMKWVGGMALVAMGVVWLLAPAADAAVVYYFSADALEDAGMKTHLGDGIGQTAEGLGHTVMTRNTSNASYADALSVGADVIIISGTMGSSSASGRGFQTSRIPVINFEPFSYDDFGWTGDTTYTDYGDTDINYKNTDMQVEPQAHPITDGVRSTVPVSRTIWDAPSTFAYGVPSGDADVLATYWDQPGRRGHGKSTLFVYERGDTLVDPPSENTGVTTARGRYIGLFPSEYGVDNTTEDIFDKLTPTGEQLFDQAVSHALDSRRAHWTFDNDFTDAVGDNDGTPVNGASITPSPGKSIVGNGALVLDRGNQQYVRVDDMAGELETGDDVTLTMWFRTTRGNSDLGGLPITNKADNVLFSAHNSTGAVNYFRIGTGVDGGIFLSGNDLGGPQNDEEFGSGYNDGQWHLLGGVFEGDGTTSIYVDGDEVPGFLDRPGQPKWSLAQLFSFGQEWDGGSPSNFYDGFIDDAQIWGRLLSQEEIQALYRAVIPEPASCAVFAVLFLGLLVPRLRRRRAAA